MAGASRGAHPLLVPVAIVAAVFGYVVGTRHAAPSPQRQSPARSLYHAGLVLEYPTGWAPAHGSPALPGLDLSQPLTLAPTGSGATEGLLSGRLPAGEAAPLPAAFLAGLPSLPRTEVVDLVSTPALRYTDVRPRGYGRPLVMYVIPGSGEAGPLLLACFGMTAGSPALSACEGIVTDASASGAAPGAIAPEPGYARSLIGPVQALQRERSRLRAQMATSSSTATVAALARTLAERFQAVAGLLPRLTAPQAVIVAQRQLEATLQEAARAYAALAAAAGAGSLGSYDSARTRIETAESGVDRALADYSLLGYGSG